mmetsp:Transcript_9102/g.33584  ORF Transcript_9102/g.33584 Transcript_9102/m.33584 type:complete len:680 (-) Transcript_9102:141-2180(-)|eukprot:CAMPEP_0117447006 /NCGR_PEP_ID=MMETSP0759-20121206/6644_1 /TAXON_ID=63605 /ORGANISM="Percolomonas cosmopolitus, Strain WS" /LENGTH=679 /DNA_ID=CAMNT_0005239311 /DNA_START=1330 /DNA_END=3369 /DNA_ORIENTATION=+
MGSVPEVTSLPEDEVAKELLNQFSVLDEEVEKKQQDYRKRLAEKNSRQAANRQESSIVFQRASSVATDPGSDEDSGPQRFGPQKDESAANICAQNNQQQQQQQNGNQYKNQQQQQSQQHHQEQQPFGNQNYSQQHNDAPNGQQFSQQQTQRLNPKKRAQDLDESLKNVDPFRLSVLHRTVYIGNLPPLVDEDDIFRLCMTCGPVCQVRLCGSSHGEHRFAFVEFMTDEATQKAFSFGESKTFFGRRIQFKTSNRPIIKELNNNTNPRDEQVFTTAALNLKYKLLQYCDDHDVDVPEEDREIYLREKRELEEALGADVKGGSEDKYGNRGGSARGGRNRRKGSKGKPKRYSAHNWRHHGSDRDSYHREQHMRREDMHHHYDQYAGHHQYSRNAHHYNGSQTPYGTVLPSERAPAASAYDTHAMHPDSRHVRGHDAYAHQRGSTPSYSAHATHHQHQHQGHEQMYHHTAAHHHQQVSTGASYDQHYSTQQQDPRVASYHATHSSSDPYANTHYAREPSASRYTSAQPQTHHSHHTAASSYHQHYAQPHAAYNTQEQQHHMAGADAHYSRAYSAPQDAYTHEYAQQQQQPVYAQQHHMHTSQQHMHPQQQQQDVMQYAAEERGMHSQQVQQQQAYPAALNRKRARPDTQQQQYAGMGNGMHQNAHQQGSFEQRGGISKRRRF